MNQLECESKLAIEDEVNLITKVIQLVIWGEKNKLDFWTEFIE